MIHVCYRLTKLPMHILKLCFGATLLSWLAWASWTTACWLAWTLNSIDWSLASLTSSDRSVLQTIASQTTCQWYFHLHVRASKCAMQCCTHEAEKTAIQSVTGCNNVCMCCAVYLGQTTGDLGQVFRHAWWSSKRANCHLP